MISYFSFARAMYRKADIYLFDDPLSAVDIHVQSHLFNNCIGPNGYLARQNSTRILITHQFHFMKEADWIVILKDVWFRATINSDVLKISIFFQGKLDRMCNYDDILKSGEDFVNLMKTPEEANEINYIENDGTTQNIPKQNSDLTLVNSMSSKVSLNSDKIQTTIRNQHPLDEEDQLLNDLETHRKVEGSIITNYLKSSNRPFTLAFLVISFLLVQALASFVDVYVSYWYEFLI